MIITFISDTHNKHKQLQHALPGGDVIIHAGDISSMGYEHEIRNFCDWYSKVKIYDHRILVAGNHDFGFEHMYGAGVTVDYDNIIYLQDRATTINDVVIYGSPWQPWFYNWAFNLPRNGKEIEDKWAMIPEDVDILVTHGPAFGYLDVVVGTEKNLGCEKLLERIKAIKPKIHVCGHIHSGYGHVFNGDTHFINASVLNERYVYSQKPITIEWDKKTNDIKFIE